MADQGLSAHAFSGAQEVQDGCELLVIFQVLRDQPNRYVRIVQWQS